MMNKKERTKTIIILILVATGILLYNYIATGLKDFQAGDVGLGIATTTHEVSYRGYPINQTHGNYETVLSSMRAFREQGNEVALLLGNSQLHAINYFKEGDNLAVYYLNKKAEENKEQIRFVQLSSPNLNLQELLIYYLMLRQEKIKIDWIIVGVPFRGFQLTSLRNSFVEHLKHLNLDTVALSGVVKQYYFDQVDILASKDVTGAEESETTQAMVERKLMGILENKWEAYRYRGNIRSRIKIIPGLIYQTLVAKETYFEGSEANVKLNLLFLDDLLRLCRQDNVKVLVYQPPHPESKDRFQYDLSQYNNCFKFIREQCDSLPKVYFENYENNVPLSYWGLNNQGRLDVFHFKNEGHYALSEGIFQFFHQHQKELLTDAF